MRGDRNVVKSQENGCKKGDKVVLVNSTDDSSSESDEDELNSPSIVVRSKHVMKPPKFDGKTSFETFWAQFENCASHNEWSRAQQLAY